MGLTYDNWKQQTPDEDEQENECSFCGVPTDGTYCSSDCKRADLHD